MTPTQTMNPTVSFFRRSTDTVQYKAGDVIYSAGNDDDKMYAVQSGAVDIVFNGQVIETVIADGIFGEKSLIDDQPHTTTAIAKEDSVIVPVDETKFLFLVHETPTFALQVMRVMASRLRNMTLKAF
ncbi:MAG: cyclic nucleotide-binding domain-containing protein [Chloroflexota bacterium]